MIGTYILDGHTPVPCEDTVTWGHWFKKAKRHVALDEVDGHRVSTVFLGIDHSFSGGTPILFETMVFRGYSSSDLACERCSTWEQAEAQHAAMVARVRRGEL